MKGNSIGYLFKEGFKSIWLNKLMSFASVGVLTACLILIGASVVVSLNITNLVKEVEEQNEIVAFIDDFNPDEAASKTNTIEQAIKENSNVASYTYVSKTQALEDEKTKLGDQAYVLDGLENDNPYPAHFIIRIKDLEKLKQTTEEIRGISGVYLVNSATDIAETLITIKHVVQSFGIATFTILVLVSLVIISNTVRLTVFARRREINIMKLVGATNSFIRLPFIIEGVVLGLISAVIAYFSIYGCYTLLISRFDFSFPFALNNISGFIPFNTIAPIIAICFLGAGVLTGIFGSTLSMRKHLKV